MKKDTRAIFKKMIDDMCVLSADEAMLDACMQLDAEAMKHVPLRYRIIALGFARRFTLQELNEKLKQQGCPGLYARNFWEATLIFAFKNGMNYDAWKKLAAECAELDHSAEDDSFGKKITYADLEKYVLENSDNGGSVLMTRMRTRMIENGLTDVGSTAEALKAYLVSNEQSFSLVREKTRYYFCKYLYYYLNRRIEDYLAACRKNRGVDEALSRLLALKVVTTLRRNKTMSEEKKLAMIRESAISCGEIFDMFNYFYFDYVSLDWTRVLTEYYEDPSGIPAKQKKALAAALRKGRPDLKKTPDDEVIRIRVAEMDAEEDEAYGLDGTRGYGKNRGGEHAVYKFIKGTLDIDRTALLCFLLFFASDADMPNEHKLTRDRITRILLSCGFAGLREEDDFDWFVGEFVEVRHPMELLNDVVAEAAGHGENSFLYHVYGSAVNNDGEFRRIMLDRK